jgi:CHAT domain-containing protein
MARIFLAVSTPVVVASQWKVESRSTTELMINFHRNRKKNGLKVVKSLRQAQIEMIQNKEFNEPYYWAAFSVIGGFAAY